MGHQGAGAGWRGQPGGVSPGLRQGAEDTEALLWTVGRSGRCWEMSVWRKGLREELEGSGVQPVLVNEVGGFSSEIGV